MFGKEDGPYRNGDRFRMGAWSRLESERADGKGSGAERD